MTNARVYEYVIVYLKGLCMGAADTVPGVSGGTIALITGIYERLVAAIAAIDPKLLGLAFRLHERSGRRRFRAALVEMDVLFLVVLGAGIMTAVVTIVRLIDRALAAYPAHTFAFFFGLIAASAIVLRHAVSFATPHRIAVAIVGFGLAALVSGGTASGTSHAPHVLFLTGIVTIPAMILPGISGGLVLIILGQYEHMAGTLVAFTDGLVGVATGGGLRAVVEPGIDVAAFISGAVVGLLGIAHAVKWALEHYRAATLTFLVFLMIGGLRAPGERILQETSSPAPVEVGTIALVACAGALLVFAVDRYTNDLEYDATSRPVGPRT